MASKKQVLIPFAIIALAIVGGFLLVKMKKPPEEKAAEIKIPVVAIDTITMAPMALRVKSQGVVSPKYETRMVAQVSGEIVTLAEEFVSGGQVKKGQMLAQIDPSDYEAALIEAQANYASAMASLELELAQGHVAKEEWKNISSASPTDLSLRRPQLRQEQARVKASEAAVKRAKRNLERTIIVAPYDALISSREIGLGSYVSTGTELGVLLSMSLAEIRLPVSTNELRYLNNDGLGAMVTLSTDIAGKTVTWQARISRNEGVVDSKSRMSYLVAQVDNPYEMAPRSLRFGTYVSAQIEGLQLENATLVPRHLLQQLDSNDRIAVLNEKSELSFKDVMVIREQERAAVITEGLNSGDQIITSALDYPVSGMKLKLQSDLPAQEKKPDDDSQVAMKKD